MLLLEHFHRLTLEPKSINELRNLVLQLAVRGKLTSEWRKNNLVTEPASELVKRIKAERLQLVQRKRNRDEESPELSKSEVPYLLPKGWAWCSLGEIVTLRSGTTFNAEMELTEGDFKYIKVGAMNMIGNEIEITTSDLYINSTPQVLNALIPSNSIIFPKRGGAIATNKKRIVKEPILVDLNTMAMTCSKNLDFKYLFYWFSSINLWKLNNGTSVPQINNKDILPLMISIPPLLEQKAIVKITEQLFKEIDQLELLTKGRIELKEKFITSALKKLVVSTQTGWPVIKEHFSSFFNDEKNIKKLRESILQLAVQGKLTPQVDTDEPASELLKRIKAEKQKLIKEGKLKKEKELQPITEEEIPFKLPKGWVWCRLGEICNLITDGTHHTPKYMETGVPFISVKDISKGVIDFSETKFISAKEHSELIKRCNPEFGDILLTKVGTTGIAKVVDVKTPFSIFVSVALLKFNQELIFNYYLESLINSPFVKKQSKEGTEGIGNKNLVLRKIHNFLIPLPPLPEQRRIILKVQQLMQHINQLEQQVINSQTQAQQLLQAVLKEGVEGKEKEYSSSEELTMATEA